jgi:hypothetical protein
MTKIPFCVSENPKEAAGSAQHFFLAGFRHEDFDEPHRPADSEPEKFVSLLQCMHRHHRLTRAS